MPCMLYRAEGTYESLQKALRVGFWGICVGNAADTEYDDRTGIGPIGDALFKSGVARDSLFIRTSVIPDYESLIPTTIQAHGIIVNSLCSLNLTCVDCLLLNLPDEPEDYETTIAMWSIMEDAVRDGSAQQLGLSNVASLEQLKRLYAETALKPA